MALLLTLDASVAVQYGARLVTLDVEQLERAPVSIGACQPNAALRLLQTAQRGTRP